MNKVIILILSTKDSEYGEFRKSIRGTWYINAKKRGIRCIFYSGGNEVDELIDDELKLNCDDSIIGSSKKLYKALKFIDENEIEYTHIYRTNLSSFLFIDDFIKFTENLNQTFYGGVKLYYNHLGIIENYRKLCILFKLIYNKIRFMDKMKLIKGFCIKILKFRVIEYASGAGFILSKDLVNKIIHSRNINFNLIDDVMIGEILQKTDIIYIPRYDILYENKMDEKCFHVRLKTKNRNNDVSKMYHLNNFSNLNDFLKKDSDK